MNGDNARLQQLEISDQAQFEEVPTPSDMVWVGQWTGHIFENRYLGGYSDTYTLVSTATEGKWGTVDWTLKDGVLTMSGGIGMNVNNLSPWRAIASEVKKVVVTDKIVAPADMSGLFWRFDKVTEFVGLEKIDTSGVVNLWNTFSGTKSLRRIDLTSWDVSKVFDFDNTFFESGVEILNLSTWNPQSVMHMSSTFASMSRLKYLDISGLSSSSSRSLFDENVQKLRTLVLGENIQLMNVPSSSDRNWVGENFGHTFSGNYEGGPADTYHLEAVTASDTWGSVDWRLEENILYLSEGAGTNTDNRSPWAEIASEVETVVLEGDLIAPEDSSSLFADFVHVTEYIGLDRMDISQTRDIGAMFQNNKFVASLDVGDWDTSNVINMSEVFEHCTDLNQLEIQNWKVENVSSLSYFLRGTKLESLDLSGWKISNANLKRTFEGMSELKKLNISNFDTFGDTSEEMMSGLPNLVELTLGDRTFLDSLDLSEGKFWQGDETNHQFTILYGAGYADTYRLVDGVLSTTGIVFLDDRNEKQIGWQVLSGEPGSTISLSTIKIPDGYELQNPDDTIQLSENGVFEDGVINEERTLKRVHKTTTRTIHFRGVPEGYPEKEVQEIKWEWEWLEDSESLKSRLFFFDDLVHSPQSGYEAFAVPEIDGYEADIAVVEAKEFDDELAELPADDEVVVTYTKLDTGDGGDQNPDPNPSQPDPDNGSGSGGSTGSGNSGTGSTGTGSVGGGQLTNLSTGGSTTAGQNQALPQTGSQVASGLTLLGLGLLGLLGFTKRRKRD